MTGKADIKEDVPGEEQEGASVELTEEEVGQLPPKEETKGGDPESDEPDLGDGQPQKRRAKPRVNFNARIGKLTAEKSEVERTAAALKAELDELRPKVTEYEGAALHYGRQAVQNEIKLLERDLAKADGEQDSEAKAAITSKLAAAQAQLARFPTPSAEPEKKAEPAPRAEEKPKVEERPEVPPDLVAQPDTPKAAWLASNPWFDNRSDQYDEAMASVARRYGGQLNQYLQSQGRGDLIGSEWYFQQIDAEQQRVFPDAYENVETEAPPPPMPRTPNRGLPPMKQTPGGVAGPSRAPAAGTRTRIDLTAEEKDFALNLPRKKHADGRMFSDDEMIKSYALHKANPNHGPVRVTYTGRNGS